MKTAKTPQDLKPFIELCKVGKLFEVQKWVEDGKPFLLPDQKAGTRWKSPLEYTMERGFHSLVQVLLEAGTPVSAFRYDALSHAIELKRLDLIKLLAKHGADLKSACMVQVFETWTPEIMDYFIENGADLETDFPLAVALTWRIKTALGVYKRYKDRLPSFKDQLNIALRCHCKEGDTKWASLLLWAGADPYSHGPYDVHDDVGYDTSAFEQAILGRHNEILELNKMKINLKRPEIADVFESACRFARFESVEKMLDQGFKPTMMEDPSIVIQILLDSIDWDYSNLFSENRKRKNINTYETKQKMRLIHLLARHGFKWTPKDRSEIASARRSLLKMKPDYTMEFIWIMAGYDACKVEDIKELIRTPTMSSLISEHRSRLKELLASFKKPD